jgi:tripartite motif-containing protein 71
MRRVFITFGFITAFLLTMTGGVVAKGGNQDTIKMPEVSLRLAIDTGRQGVISQVDVAVDEDQNIYVVDKDLPRVLKYNKQGRFLLSWGSRGSGPGQFNLNPQDVGYPPEMPSGGFIAVDSHGNVFISDAYNLRVQKFDSHGRFLSQFGTAGSGDGQFDPPLIGPIYIDKHDNIWVSSFPRVQKFDSKGRFLASYTGDGYLNGAAMGVIDQHGNIFIADLLNSRIVMLDSSGKFIKAWGTPGTGPGQLNMPVKMVLDEESRLYVADNTDRIQVYTTDGNFLGQWSTPGKGYPPFDVAISGLAIDKKGNIYAADWPHPAIYGFAISH